MDNNYLQEIKRIIDSEDLVSFHSLKEFTEDTRFYIFQYPSHFVDYFGQKRWDMFENVYLKSRIKGVMNIPDRWKYLVPEHIKDKRVLDLGSNIGAELYFIKKKLNPRYVLGIEYNKNCVELANLAFRMHDLYNVCVLQGDLVNGIDQIDTEDKSFNVTTLGGFLFSFEFTNHLDYAKEKLNKLFCFIERVTTNHFYFLEMDRFHYEQIVQFFGEAKNLEICKFRKTKEYKHIFNKVRKQTVDVDFYRKETKNNMYSGYVEIN